MPVIDNNSRRRNWNLRTNAVASQLRQLRREQNIERHRAQIAQDIANAKTKKP